MPKQLMFDMYKGYMRETDEYVMAGLEQTTTQPDIVPDAEQDADIGEINNEPTA